MYINPKSFYEPLAIGAPEPLKQIPAVPMRMIHFFDPSNSRMIDKMKDIIPTVDVLLGNLEDAVASDKKNAEVFVSTIFCESHFDIFGSSWHIS